MKLINQGAEAKIYLDKNIIIKERIPKTYRIKELDEKIRKQRTRREISMLEKASKIINVPKILMGSSEKEFKIFMEFIDGKKLSESLDLFDDKKRIEICNNIGKEVALMHSVNIIHGDLTTSNMILKDDKVFLIDFGLSFIDPKVEHKAVDLHLIRQALDSKHYKNYESSFKSVLDGYKKYSNESKEVLDRLNKVDIRGRYKQKNKN
ncbi:Kae1-associated serine/threonine protein kinase [Candidatus Woesearchaeota archaeon]|nr:Kae1-associated serine/threonine protein kinase [Candidatus Woesearchaeota archaeon]